MRTISSSGGGSGPAILDRAAHLERLGLVRRQIQHHPQRSLGLAQVLLGVEHADLGDLLLGLDLVDISP